MAYASLQPVSILPAHEEPINCLGVSSDGVTLATGDTLLCCKVWRRSELLAELHLGSILDKVRSTERIRGLAFSPDGQFLYAAAGDSLLAFGVGAQDLRETWSYTPPRLFAFLIVSPTSIAVSARGTVAAVFDNGTLLTFDEAGQKRTSIRHNAVPKRIAYTADERILGMDSFSLSMWSPESRRPIWLRSLPDRAYCMALSSDGKLVAVRSLFTTSVYEVEGGARVAEVRQGRGLPLVAFAPGAHCLFVGSQHSIMAYDLDRSESARLALDDAELISLGVNSDGSQVIGGCSDGALRIWDNPVVGSIPLLRDA